MVVEDDAELRALLCRGLGDEGLAVRAFATGAELLSEVDEKPPDALVIDICLPDTDGRDLCQALRARGLQAPVLFLTARDALVDRLAGFDAGGDDYVTKPFALSEVAARLQALLRRAGASGSIDAVGLKLDPVSHSVNGGDVTTPLTPTEFRLLARLLANPAEAVRRRDLVRAGWPHGAFVRENTLDVYIARLRRKLRELPSSPAITTVHGVGYRIA
jgi:two-component system response regulator MprA